MKGLMISNRDEYGGLSFDLIDILHAIGPDVTRAIWHLSGVECVGGEAADELHRLSDTGAFIPGSTLLALALDVTQIIEGDFHGFLGINSTPWTVIRAVDSTSYDVLSDDDKVLQKVKRAFKRTEELTYDIAALPSLEGQPGDD